VRPTSSSNTRIRRSAFWQNVYCERLIGTVSQKCTDHRLTVNERRLGDVLREYAAYYNEAHPHISLDRNAPEPRAR
jgi:transposase InsO family protein